MDILVSMKKAYAKVSSETQSAWKKFTSWLAHKKSSLPKWTNVQIGGLVIMIVCIGLLASVLKQKYSGSHGDNTSLNMLDAHATPTVAMLKNLEEKIDSLAQQAEQHATHVAEMKQEVARNNEMSMLDGQQTPTVAMFKQLEEKVDALEQQQAAYVEETIKKEVKAQVAERNRDVKNKKLQVLRKLVQEIDDK